MIFVIRSDNLNSASIDELIEKMCNDDEFKALYQEECQKLEELVEIRLSEDSKS